MSDLGLQEVTDDQLVSLLAEVTTELLSRDRCVQQVAQAGILSIAQKQQTFIRVLKEELAAAERQYIESLRQDVRQEILRAVQAGELNVGANLGSDGEAKIIAEVSKEQIQKIKQDLQRDPENSSFQVSYNGTRKTLICSYHSAGQNWDTNRNLTVNKALAESIRRAVLGAFGIPTD
jgi:hypothetical protein